MSDKQEIANAINEIWTILRTLRGPREAAKALAGAHIMLMEADGATSETVRAKMNDVSAAVLESWAKRNGAPSLNQ